MKYLVAIAVLMLAACSESTQSVSSQPSPFSVTEPTTGQLAAAKKPVKDASLVLVIVQDNNVDGSANQGDVITFTVSPDNLIQPWVFVECTQNGARVYTAGGDFSNGEQWPFPLGSPAWQSGAADCVASLKQWDYTETLTTLGFHVNN